MKHITSKFVSALICLGALAGPQAHAAAPRLDAWGQGVSEFEAVKSAYKKILADALKLSVANAGSLESSLRRSFERDIEEDLLRVQRTYFPDAAPPACRGRDRQFECLIVTPVRMDELEARIRVLLGVTGSDTTTVTALRLALVAKNPAGEQNDLLVWLHNKLETDFGHDVYLARKYVDADALRDQCQEYRTRADAYEARGDNYRKTAQEYRESHSACKSLLDRDLIIVVEDATSRYEAFNTRDQSMAGELRLRLQLLQTRSGRPLPAPRPQSITQYGRGDTAALAQSDLRDRLYETAANYISQQMNQVLIASVSEGRVSAQGGGEREYQVVVSGVNPDLPRGRAQLALVRDWFAGPGGCPLKANFKQGSFGERIYACRSERQPDWTSIMDALYVVLDKAKEDARLEVDRSGNFTVAFQGQGAADAKSAVNLKLENTTLKRRIAVEEKSMEVRRRDAETGVAIAVSEAVLRIRNKHSRDLLLTVTPVWTGQDGSSLPAPHSHRQYLLLPARTSERFVFRAPSKFAGAVTVEIDCPGDTCEIKK